MRLLVLGTGRMADENTAAFAAIDGVELAACVDLDHAKATEFAARHSIPHAFASLDDALNAVQVDAVANATPDPAHFPTTMQVLDAGLHIFCEKPLATNHADAATMTARAQETGVINGVNLTYRNVSALQKAREIIASGALGDLRHFSASYLQSWLTQPAWGDWKTDPTWLWRLSTEHGSNGVAGDIGIHIFDFLTYAASSDIQAISPLLTTFDKAPGNRIGDYNLDANDSMVLTAQLGNGASGVIHATRYAPGHLNDLSLKIFGTQGGLELTNEGPLGTLKACTGDDQVAIQWRDVPLSPVKTNYQRFAQAVQTGTPMTPNFADATRLQAVIDATLAPDTGLQPIPS